MRDSSESVISAVSISSATTLRNRSSSRSPRSQSAGAVPSTAVTTVSSPPTVGSLRWRRYELKNVFLRIRNSQAFKFVPGVNWCSARSARAYVSCTRSSASVSLPVR